MKYHCVPSLVVELEWNFSSKMCVAYKKDIYIEI